MQGKRTITMVGVTVFLAAATGQLMQSGPNLFPKATAAPVELAKIDPLPKPAMLAEPTRIVTLAGSTGGATPALDPKRAAPRLGTPSPLPRAVLDCTPKLTLAAEPAAMVHLALIAACNGNARVVIRHAGLVVTGLTDSNGKLDISVPAFAEAATFAVSLPGDTAVTGEIAVPSLGSYDRVAVQWQGDDAFQLHAFEFGADYGDAGHVWVKAARNPAFALQATGGFLTELGAASVTLPMLAQIYTYPSANSQQSGVVRLTVEAEISKTTCGRDLLGETLQADAGVPVKVVDLTLAMPACDAAGGFVVLKNLLPDVKIAAN